MMFCKRTSRNGFSLIEILVVVAIISIITAISTPYVIGVIRDARRTQASAKMDEISFALDKYYQEKRKYPDATELVTALQGKDKDGEVYFEFSAGDIGTRTGQTRFKPITMVGPSAGSEDDFTINQSYPGLGNKFLKGPYDHPIIYVPEHQYRSDDPTISRLVAWDEINETFYKPNSYQLWWPGEDGMVRRGEVAAGNETGFRVLLNIWDDSYDNDGDGLFDKADNYGTSLDMPTAHQRLIEDDVLRN